MTHSIQNILHVSTPSSWRGGEQQLAYLYEELAKKGLNQYILCRKGSELAKKGKAKNWNIIECPKVTAIDLNFALKIKRVCREHKIQLIHTHDSHAHSFAILSASIWQNKTPIVVSRRVDFPIKKTWFSKYKYNHPLVKKILCVSKAILELTAPDIKNKTILKTIHSGIDLSRFPFPKEFPGSLRKEFNIPSSKTIVGNVAAISPHKDYFTFVDTVEQIIQQRQDVHFLIIGTGPMEEEIKNYVDKKKLNSNITFTGFRNDIPKILPELDVFLITSETEGLGTSVIDAFACKIPVVATRAGGIPELVIHNKSGLLAEVKQPLELAQQLNLLLDGKIDKEAMIQHQQNILVNFTRESTALKTLKEYNSILA